MELSKKKSFKTSFFYEILCSYDVVQLSVRKAALRMKQTTMKMKGKDQIEKVCLTSLAELNAAARGNSIFFLFETIIFVKKTPEL